VSFIVRQTDLSDCGIACIVSMLRHYGIQRELYQLKLKHPLKLNYYSFADLRDLLNEFKLESVGYQTDLQTLKLIDKPVIAQLVVIKNIYLHFVVINHVDEHSVYYMDPTEDKIVKCKYEEFSKIWSGMILKVARDNSKEYDDTLSRKPSRLIIQTINRRTYIALILILLCQFLLLIFWFTQSQI
jgi:ABC-type bacteriocin/lantibiotic exporter with double-glycine peptidase domain